MQQHLKDLHILAGKENHPSLLEQVTMEQEFQGVAAPEGSPWDQGNSWPVVTARLPHMAVEFR